MKGGLFVLFCFPRQVLFFFGSWFYALLLLGFSAFLLFAFPAFCFSCFSTFHASLLLCFTCFFSFLLLCFPCFSASLLPVFTASLFFSFLLLLSLLFVSLNETLKTLGETQRNPKEILTRTTDKKPLNETLNEP